MCNFISWKEIDSVNYFLTKKELRTKKGKELSKYLGVKYWEDICGHGAIEYYYPELKGKGINKECEDFSTPKNFPPEIVEAIKIGLFYGIGICLDILSKKGLQLFQKTYPEFFAIWTESNKAKSKYNKALTEYNKAEAKYNKALTEYNKARAKCDKAMAKYDMARTEYCKAMAEYCKAMTEYDKAMTFKICNYFWKIATQKQYRKLIWR